MSEEWRITSRFLTWVTGKIDAHQLRWGEIVGGADLGQEDKEFSF